MTFVVLCWFRRVAAHLWSATVQGGMYVFQLMDYNVTNPSLILLALFEVGALAWVYGTERLTQDFLAMTGKRVSSYFLVCLKFLAPLLILVSAGRRAADYPGKGEGYRLPGEGE